MHGGEKALPKPSTLCLNPCPRVQHIAVEDESFLQVSDLCRNHFTVVYCSPVFGHHAELVQVALALLLDAPILLPGDDGLVTDVLVNLSGTVENRAGDVPEKFVDQSVVGLVINE